MVTFAELVYETRRNLVLARRRLGWVERKKQRALLLRLVNSAEHTVRFEYLDPDATKTTSSSPL